MVAPGGGAWLLWGTCVVAPGGMHSCSGGHVWLLLGGGVVTRGACMVALGGCAWLLPGGMRGCSGGHGWLLPGGLAWDTTRYGDTVNERAVRILLECILVYIHKVFQPLWKENFFCLICDVRTTVGAKSAKIY